MYQTFTALGAVIKDIISVWILEVDHLETNGGTGPRAVVFAVSPGMDAVMCVCYLIISLSPATARHACSSFQQFNLAPLVSHMSRLGTALMGEVIRCEPRVVQRRPDSR